MWRVFVLLIVFVSSTLIAKSQDCPKEDPKGPSIPSEVRQLSGVVEYHDNIRQWTSLSLAKPVCGTHKIQLLDDDVGATATISRFRGCRVQVTGKLDTPSTGYYSESLFFLVDSIRPTGNCAIKQSLPLQFTGGPASELDRYHVAMRIDYRPDGGHVLMSAYARGRSLRPWQRYASYYVTGLFGFYAYCGDGFTLEKLKGNPEAHPWILDGYAAFDPESAAQKGVRILHISYICKRSDDDSNAQ